MEETTDLPEQHSANVSAKAFTNSQTGAVGTLSRERQMPSTGLIPNRNQLLNGSQFQDGDKIPNGDQFQNGNLVPNEKPIPSEKQILNDKVGFKKRHVSINGHTPVKSQPINGQAPVKSQPINGQVPVKSQPINGQVPVKSQPINGQAPVESQPINGQAPVKSQPINGQAPVKSQPINGQAPVKHMPTTGQAPEKRPIGQPMAASSADAEENKQKIPDFDDLIDLIGLGRWTVLMVAPYICWALVLPYFSLGGAFLNPTVAHWCAAGPPVWEEKDGQSTKSQCRTYDWAAVQNSTEFAPRVPVALEAHNWTGETDGLPTKECDAWEYDTSVFKSTVTTEFDLVCGSAALSPFFQSFYYFGTTLGEPLLGYLSDRLGRRWVLRRVWVLFVCAAVTSVVTTSYPLLLAMRLLLGVVHSAGSVAYVMVLETSPARVRSVFGLALTTVYAMTGITFGGLAYFFREWRTLQAICILPGLLHLSYLFVLEESPRWLLQAGKTGEARRVLEGAAALHCVPLPRADLLQEALVRQQEETQASSSVARGTGCLQYVKESLKLWLREFMSLLRTPVLRRISFAMFGCWFVVGLSYWGMSLSGGSFSSDPFLYMALSSLMEVPGYVWIIPLVPCLGRRVLLALNFVVCACAMLLILLIPPENIWVIFSLAMLGKLFITGAYNLLYLYSVELFPTCVRNRGLSVSSMMARVAAVSAPFVTKSLASKYEYAPSLVFGGAAACGALLSLLLPESKGKPLLDSVEQVEQTYGKKPEKNSSGKPGKSSSGKPTKNSSGKLAKNSGGKPASQSSAAENGEGNLLLESED